MTKYPKISVITPSFNQGKFIETTIKSVVNQKYPNLEYIIKDAGSRDETVKIIKKYARAYPKIIKWVSKRDRGQADGINQGIKLATGEILAYLNSDDVYLPGTLKKVGSFFARHPRAMWFTGNYFVINEKGKKIHSYVAFYKKLLWQFSSFWMLSVANYIIQPSTFWRRQVTREIGLFDESQHLVLDYDYWLRIMQKYPLHIIHSPLSLFRIHGSSKGKGRFEKQFQEEYEIIKRYTKNPILLLAHRIHSAAIILVYKFIK
jgi:glycosyltransferase involved in cell wall biosynthesis